MTETELERLVVRLTGDGSSYNKMVKEGVEGGKALAASMKTIEDANRQMDSYMKTSVGQWREHNRAMNETKLLLAEYAIGLKSGAQAWSEYKQSARQALSEIKSQLVEIGRTWVQTTNFFGSGGNLISQGLNLANPGSWAQAARGTTSAILANMRTVMRDESTFSVGANGAVTVNPKRRWITAAEAEREDYKKSLVPRYQAISREEREYRRGLQEAQTAGIENRQERIKAMRLSASANLNDEFKARKEADMLSKQLENMEKNVMGRGTAAISSLLTWTENPYEAGIAKQREKVALSRKEVLEAEDRRRKSVRDVEESERAGKKSDDDMLKNMMRNTATIGMTDKQQHAFSRRNAGANEMTIASELIEMGNQDSRRLKRGLEEEETERGYIGKSSREVRDLRTRAKMKREGFAEDDIKAQLDSFTKTDKAQDAQDLTDKIKALTKELNNQAAAYRNNHDVMQPYESLLSKITDKEQKAAFVATVKNEDLERRASLIRDSNPQEQFKRAQESINELHDKNQISMSERDKALNDAKRSIFGTPSGRGYIPSQGINGVEAGGPEALSNLATFRELAFGSGSGAGGGGRPTKTTVRQRQAIARAKAASPRQRLRERLDAAKARSKSKRSVRQSRFRLLHGYGMGEIDPTAGVVNRMLSEGMPAESDGVNPMVGEEILNATPNEALRNDGPMRPLDHGGMSIHTAGSSDYWKNLEGRGDGVDPTKKGLFGEDDTSKKSEEHLREIAEKFRDNNTVVIKLADLK